MDILSKYGPDFLRDCSCFVSFVELSPRFDEKKILLEKILELNDEFVRYVHDHSVRKNKRIRSLGDVVGRFIELSPPFPEEISLARQIGVIIGDFDTFLRWSN